MTQELLQHIASRAGQLSLMTIKQLRHEHPDSIDGTQSGSQWQGVGRERLIADILFDEFQHECNGDVGHSFVIE